MLDGVAGLRRELLRHPETFARTLTEKLLVYALGRSLTFHDMPVVRAVARDAATHDYHFSSLILGIAKSVPFQMKVKKATQAAQVATAENLAPGRSPERIGGQAKAPAPPLKKD